MNPTPDRNEKLEQLIHRTLRELPARRAPSTLEQRVMAEIERRAALPWWKQSFAHWPVVARVGFLLISAGVVKVAWSAVLWAMGGFDAAQLQQTFSAPLLWIENARAVADAAVGFCQIILRNIPALWLYSLLAIASALYAAFFGLGAAAYRSLYAVR